MPLTKPDVEHGLQRPPQSTPASFPFLAPSAVLFPVVIGVVALPPLLSATLGLVTTCEELAMRSHVVFPTVKVAFSTDDAFTPRVLPITVVVST
jgi:hypothetical protein